MEVIEIIAPPSLHKTPNEDCPFCPPPDKPGFKTYPGSANNSGVLAEVMETPSALVPKQGGARPQAGRLDEDGYAQEQAEPDPRECDDKKRYTFQAHHLISGKQALQGEPMEDWILASGRN